MGARVYLPTLGRFTAVDPIDGGTDNGYVYPLDPINEWDLTGQFGIPSWAKTAWKFVGKHSQAIGVGLAVVGAGACIVATAGVCIGAMAATAVAGGVVDVAGARYKGDGWGSALRSGAMSAASGLFKMKQVRAVRWFGESRNYKTLAKALTKKPGRDRMTKIIKSTAVSQAVGFGTSWLKDRLF